MRTKNTTSEHYILAQLLDWDEQRITKMLRTSRRTWYRKLEKFSPQLRPLINSALRDWHPSSELQVELRAKIFTFIKTNATPPNSDLTKDPLMKNNDLFILFRVLGQSDATVAEGLGISRRHFLNLRKDPHFPPHIRKRLKRLAHKGLANWHPRNLFQREIKEWLLQRYVNEAILERQKEREQR